MCFFGDPIRNKKKIQVFSLIYNTNNPRYQSCGTYNFEDEEQSNQSGSVYEDMLTGVELYLTSDYGVQYSGSYQVKPSELIVKAKEKGQFDIKLLTLPEQTLDGTMLLRILPTVKEGKGWYRPSPQLQYIKIRTAHRSASIHASCTEVVIAVCALDIPSSDVMRLRKHFYLRNAGDSAILTKLCTPPPWRASLAPLLCDKHCTSTAVIATDVVLFPRSSVEMFVEVCISAKEYWPENDDTEYPTQGVHTSALYFYDVDNILLLTMPLTLLIDQPRLYIDPNVLDLGVVSDGHTSKGYFSVSHSSPTATVEVMVTCSDEDFRLFPTNMALSPGETKYVYVQYIARWRPYISNIRTIIDISYIGAARAWCRAALSLSVFIQRCSERCAKGDYTDDTHLVPDV